jgi:GAF domain-containing protein
MLAGLGPRIAPNAQSIPAYETAAIGRRLKIRAYIGVPLVLSDGSLFGTICAVHPTPRSEVIVNELPLIELLAGMLSGLLNHELEVERTARQVQQVRPPSDAETDSMTGL